MPEKLSVCDKCQDTRIEMVYPNLEMTAYICPGCGTIRVKDHRGEYPDDVTHIPEPLIGCLRTQTAA